MNVNKTKLAYYYNNSHTNYRNFVNKKPFATIDNIDYYLIVANPLKPLNRRTEPNGLTYCMPPSEKVLSKERTFGIVNADGEIIIPCQYSVIYDLDFENGHLCEKHNSTLIRYKNGVELPCSPIDEFFQDLKNSIYDMDCFVDDDFSYFDIINPFQDCIIDLLNRLPEEMTVKQLMNILES